MNIKSLWFASFATLVLAGCDVTPAVVGGGGSGGSGGGTGGSGGIDPGGCSGKDNTCAPLAPEYVAAVSALFRQNCADCHGKGQARGDLADIFDVDELKRKGLIGETAKDSPLFNRVNADEMPTKDQYSPRTGKLVTKVNDEQKKALRDWINAGAPPLRGERTRISVDDYSRRLRRDQSSLPRPEQEDLVYVDFHAVYNNPRYSDVQLSAFVNATLKLLNGLDPIATRVQGPGNGVSVVNDDNGLPIAVRFNPSRFHLDQNDIDRIIASTNRQDLSAPFDCDVPAIPVLDFLQIASADDFFNPITENFESIYSNIMLRRLFQEKGIIAADDNDRLVFNPIPKATFIIPNGFTNVSEFTLFDAFEARGLDLRELDVLFNTGNDNERIVRACLLNSGVSAANRCMDRFALKDISGGSFWVSWDALSIGSVNDGQDFFRSNLVGPANPPDAPLVRAEGAFVVDGGEAIFQLPNFMQAYVVYNGDLNFVTNPPTFAVLNPTDSERGNFISVRACSSCHANYTIPFKDAAFDTALKGLNGSSNAEAGALIKLVQDQEKWNFQLADDSARYLEELRDVYVTRGDKGELPDGIYNLGSQYLSDLSNEDIAAEIGLLDAADLEDTIDNITDLTADLRSVFGGGMSRENFTINYQAIITQISTSNVDFLRGCVSREVSEPGDFGDNETPDGQNNGDGT